MKRIADNAFAATGPLVKNYGIEALLYSQQEEAPISILTKEIFYLIMDQLRARDLEAFGNTCKHFKQLTEDAPMWEKLYRRMGEFGCVIERTESFKKLFNSELEKKNKDALLAKVYFECENHYAKRNITKACGMVNQLRKRIPKQNPLYIKVLLKKAELLATTPVLEKNLKTVKHFANQILQNEKALPCEKAQANYLKIKKKYFDENEADHIFYQMNEIRKDPHLPVSSRIEAEIYTCLIVLNDLEMEPAFEKESGFISELDESIIPETHDIVAEAEQEPILFKENALDCLEKISKHKDASIEQKAFAAIHVAKEYYKQKTKEKRQQAGDILNQITKDLDVSDVIRMEAALHLALMRFEHQTKLINDEEAVDYLKQVKCCQYLDEELTRLADFYLAMFRYQERTKEITDEEAFTLLEIVDGNEFIEEFVRYEAMLYQAIMWYENRIKRLSYEDAMELLEAITSDPHELSYPLVSKTNLYTALMLFDSKQNDKKAYKIFDVLANDELAEKNDRNKAKEYRLLMLNSGRGPKYYNNPFCDTL